MSIALDKSLSRVHSTSMNNTTKQIAALVGVTEVNADSMKIVRARVYGMGISSVCGRCGGGGRYSFNGSHSICYGCEGRGEVATDLTKKSTLDAVTEAINAGALARYFEARAARTAAKKTLVPLYNACEAAYLACYAEIYATSGFAPYGNNTREETHAVVMSVAFNLITRNTELNKAAFAVDMARRFGDLDIDQGVLFAAEILKSTLAEIESLRETVARLDRETLRSECYAPQKCKACGQVVQFSGSDERGQRRSCDSLRDFKGESCRAIVTC